MAFSADLFLIEQLDELEAIILPRITLENMHRMITLRNAKQVITYGYHLSLVFDYFEMPNGTGVESTVKHTFSIVTLIEC